MKILLILLALWPSWMLGGYTKEHIEESCVKYKEKTILDYYRQFSYLEYDTDANYMAYRVGFRFMYMRGIDRFQCAALVEQLEEDHS